MWLPQEQQSDCEWMHEYDISEMRAVDMDSFILIFTLRGPF
jgi:hypothetical protein